MSEKQNTAYTHDDLLFYQDKYCDFHFKYQPNAEGRFIISETEDNQLEYYYEKKIIEGVNIRTVRKPFLINELTYIKKKDS